MGIRTDILTDKKDTPTLSIITVNLNNRDGLKRTIDSVVRHSPTMSGLSSTAAAPTAAGI